MPKNQDFKSSWGGLPVNFQMDVSGKQENLYPSFSACMYITPEDDGTSFSPDIELTDGLLIDNSIAIEIPYQDIERDPKTGKPDHDKAGCWSWGRMQFRLDDLMLKTINQDKDNFNKLFWAYHMKMGLEEALKLIDRQIEPIEEALNEEDREAGNDQGYLIQICRAESGIEFTA